MGFALSKCMDEPTTSMRVRRALQRLAGAVGVGGVATLVDLSVLVVLVELGGLSPNTANVPALLCGALVQFVGCRALVFRKSKQSVAKSLGGFALVECATLALNALVFGVLITALPTLPYAALRLVSTFVVFIGFSFPAWHWVFTPPSRS